MKKGLAITLSILGCLFLLLFLTGATFTYWLEKTRPSVAHDDVAPWPGNPDRKSFNEGWTFTLEGQEARTVNLPHDWGVEGPFDSEYPGSTGKLAWWGKATYEKTLTLSKEDLKKDISLEIDGAMSFAAVSVNGTDVGEWPYGYASFAVDLTPALREGENRILVRLDNPKESSRWYPGGGIYRNVWLVKSEKIGVARLGTAVTTSLAERTVTLSIELKNDGDPVPGTLTTRIVDPEDTTRTLGEATETLEAISGGMVVRQTLSVPAAGRWSPDNPKCYLAVTTVSPENGPASTCNTWFGIREAEFRPDGFYLNGEKTHLKGVCLHHDAGALGAVWSTPAWVRRLKWLKSMGCNAIRTSHNPPAPELLDLCDRMGFLVLDELTDTWTIPKKKNGYAILFDEWSEKDLVALIRRDRNHPCVIAWSIGNECEEQGHPEKWDIPRRLTEICHREDPTRPTTAGNNNLQAASTPYAETIDVYGFNYKPHAYAEFRDAHPGQPFFGAETASCISTRGYYLFPVQEDKGKGWTKKEEPYQVSSYDLYAPSWAYKPDYEWAFEDQVPECAGEFVWTGYDYLGEPTPYTKESRSSYFGILDLAGFPKDRYWLYKARWAHARPFLHILPHWTWPGREGEVTPVHVYTNLKSAELFVNGKSQGVRTKGPGEYRLRWDDVVYEPGTLTVKGTASGDEYIEIVRTAGEPSRAEVLFETSYNLAAGSKRLLVETEKPAETLIFAYVRILDRKGNFVPTADTPLSFSVSGPAEIVATDNGDPTSLVPFYSLEKQAFNGLCAVILRPTGEGKISLRVRGEGLKGSRASVKIHQP